VIPDIVVQARNADASAGTTVVAESQSDTPTGKVAPSPCARVVPSGVDGLEAQGTKVKSDAPALDTIDCQLEQAVQVLRSQLALSPHNLSVSEAAQR
jgi:hypothetical protein